MSNLEAKNNTTYLSIPDVIKTYNVFLTHAFIEGDLMTSKTSHNPWDKKLDILYAFSPLICCSSFRPNHHEESLLGKAGVLINDGEIQAAFNADITSSPVGINKRKYRYEPDSLDVAIKTRSTGWYNEIIIDDCKIAGLYMNITHLLHHNLKPEQRGEFIQKMKDKSKEYSLPVYAIENERVVLLGNFFDFEGLGQIINYVRAEESLTISPSQLLDNKNIKLDQERIEELRLKLVSEHAFNLSESREQFPLLSAYSTFVGGRLNYIYNSICNNKLSFETKPEIYDNIDKNGSVPSGAHIEIMLNITDPFLGFTARIFKYNGEIYIDKITYFYEHIAQKPRYHSPERIKGYQDDRYGLLDRLIGAWIDGGRESRVLLGYPEEKFIGSISDVFNIYKGLNNKEWGELLNYYIVGLVSQAKKCGDSGFVERILSLNLPINTDEILKNIQKLEKSDGSINYSYIVDLLIENNLSK